MLTDYQAETVEALREITLQLILIAVGVYAVVGGMIANKTQASPGRGWLLASFIVFAVSIFFGLLTYGALVYDLTAANLTVAGRMQRFACAQWFTFLGGGILLIVFLYKNV